MKKTKALVLPDPCRSKSHSGGACLRIKKGERFKSGAEGPSLKKPDKKQTKGKKG